LNAIRTVKKIEHRFPGLLPGRDPSNGRPFCGSAVHRLVIEFVPLAVGVYKLLDKKYCKKSAEALYTFLLSNVPAGILQELGKKFRSARVDEGHIYYCETEKQ